MRKRLFAMLVCLIVFSAAFSVCSSAATTPTVTVNVTNMEYNFNDTIDIMEAGIFVTFNADDDYMMPDDIEVTVGGQPITEYDYGKGVNYLSGSVLILPDVITGDVVITASGLAKYSVKFKGEMYSIAMPVPDGKSLKEQYPDYHRDLEKEGYTFEGWFESTDGGVTFADSPFDFTLPRTEDVTLYPKWTAIATDTPSATPVVTPTPTASPDVPIPPTSDDVSLLLPALILVFAGASMCLAVLMWRKRAK